ncbi:hypothetical protein [uncultured Roseibium sp.]|uniref:hypothetical protein n=1 Tax=uncultured Roseibium sp. TaxID=1936171 RepID=UPI0026341233|nr:hypothetical protein [uncultured Roseibium sp.]
MSIIDETQQSSELERLNGLVKRQVRKISDLEKRLEQVKRDQTPSASELRADHLMMERMLGSVLSIKQSRLLHRFISDKHDWLSKATPWYTEGAKSWLAANVVSSDRVVEYGGGRSTVWWCQHTERASVMEASPEWTFWLLLYLFDRPDALKNLRMHFVPAEWNPDFSKLSKRYWSDNRSALNESDVRRMEKDLTDPSILNGHNILVLDGAIRGRLMARFGMLDVFKDFEMVVIDNTEARVNSFSADYYFKGLPFQRLDFVAGTYDVVPDHQNGAHITSIYVREDRMKSERKINLGRPYKLSDEERDRHQNKGQRSDEEILKKIREDESYVNMYFE